MRSPDGDTARLIPLNPEPEAALVICIVTKPPGIALHLVLPGGLVCCQMTNAHHDVAGLNAELATGQDICHLDLHRVARHPDRPNPR